MKEKIIYWATTGIVSAMMLFSAFAYFTNPDIAASFIHLGFPDYFRIELGLAKALGALILIVPKVPFRVKEWAYAGFGITFVSAMVAHISSGDPITVAVGPGLFLVLLLVSRVYLERVNKPVVVG